MSTSIDNLTPTESLIDLKRYTGNEFAIPDHILTTLFDDLILAEYTDVSPDGNAIKRGNIFVPLNTAPRAWRTARVLIAGNKCSNVNITDTIVFPGDNGIPVVNLQYKDVNTGETKVVSHGVFLNEERLFGVCTEIPNESSTTDTKSTS